MSARLIAMLSTAGVLLAVALGLYWKGRVEGAARRQVQVEAARAEAVVARLETAGARETIQRVEIIVRERRAADALVADLTKTALTSEDADVPLDPGRLERLRDLDRRLCELADLAGCAADRNAERGQPALQPASTGR